MTLTTQKTASSHEQIVVTCLEMMNIPILEFIPAEVKSLKDGVYAYMHVPTTEFFEAPILSDYEDAIISRAVKKNLRCASRAEEIIANTSLPRQCMHFDFVIFTVKNGKRTNEKFFETNGGQHEDDRSFGIDATTECIISDAIKETWGVKLFRGNNMLWKNILKYLDEYCGN